MKLIEVSVKRPVLVAMVMLGLAGLGLFAYLQLPKELFPQIEFPMVTVVTAYPGAGPEEIEQLVTKELEDEISTVEGIKHITSISQQGMSVVMAEFYLEQDVDIAAMDVRAKVDLVRPILPEAAEEPIVQKFDFNAEPIMRLAVAAPRPLQEVYTLVDRRVQDRLSTVPDVASVNLVGGPEREIHVLADPQRLRAYGLSITDVVATVAAANLETPGGQIQQNRREYNIRLRGKFADLETIRNLPVPTAVGELVYLRQVARVEDAYEDIRDMVRTDLETSVGITIQKRADGNTVEVVRAVEAVLGELREILPSDYEITVQDEQATWIEGALANVFGNMRTGIFLTAVALFLFLHSLRGTLIVALTMPIAVVATFLILYMAGFSLNLMSMMGLAMTIGILVDNSVLVTENIVRYLHLGHSPKEAAVAGASNIAIAVAATTLTNVVIFVPIAFMGGIIGQFFRDLGLTATFATICSLVVSFMLTPMLASRLLTKENTTPGGPGLVARFGHGFDERFERVKGGYAGTLRWCLHHRWASLGIVVLVFLAAMRLGPMIGGEFITSMDQSKFVISVEMPTGTRLETTNEAVYKLEQLLHDAEVLPELVSTYASVGQVTGGGIGGSTQAVNIGQINVRVVDKEDRESSTEAIMNRLRPVLASSAPAGARLKLLEEAGGGGSEAPIQMQILGDDMAELKAFAAEAQRIISNEVEGAVDVDSNYREGQPEIRIFPDRDKARDAGVDVAYLTQVVQGSFEGLIANEYRDGAFSYDIRVRNEAQSRETVEDVRRMTVLTRAGERVPLVQVASVEVASGPAQLFRKDRMSMITVSADVSEVSPAEAAGAIEEKMAPLLEKYPGARIFFGGEIEMMQESFGRLFVAMVMALALTYMLLAAMLESFWQPVIIMGTLPLSLIGVLLALFLMGGTFSIFSIMAIVILIGLVINNAIIVLNYTHELRAAGKGREEAFVEAGVTRLRPMLMTNLTTIAALIPLSLGLGWAGELQAPMAMVQIGGLVTGGWIGLLLVPVVYCLFEDTGRRVLRVLPKRRVAAD